MSETTIKYFNEKIKQAKTIIKKITVSSINKAKTDALLTDPVELSKSIGILIKETNNLHKSIIYLESALRYPRLVKLIISKDEIITLIKEAIGISVKRYNSIELLLNKEIEALADLGQLVQEKERRIVLLALKTKRLETLNLLLKKTVRHSKQEKDENINFIIQSYEDVIKYIIDLIQNLPYDKQWIYYGAIGDNYLSIALFLSDNKINKHKIEESYQNTIKYYSKAIKYRDKFGKGYNIRLTWRYSNRKVHDLFFRKSKNDHTSVNQEEDKIDIIKKKLREIDNVKHN